MTAPLRETEDGWEATPEALEERTVMGTPYPLACPAEVIEDLQIRALLWAVSMGKGTLEQASKTAIALLGVALHQLLEDFRDESPG